MHIHAPVLAVCQPPHAFVCGCTTHAPVSAAICRPHQAWGVCVWMTSYNVRTSECLCTVVHGRDVRFFCFERGYVVYAPDVGKDMRAWGMMTARASHDLCIHNRVTSVAHACAAQPYMCAYTCTHTVAHERGDTLRVVRACAGTIVHPHLCMCASIQSKTSVTPCFAWYARDAMLCVVRACVARPACAPMHTSIQSHTSMTSCYAWCVCVGSISAYARVHVSLYSHTRA